MSRAFVKEDDQEEQPIIPQRAPLPNGKANYVTAIGRQQLLKEKESLEEERSELPEIEGEQERRIAKTVINEKLKLLDGRIASAQVLGFDEVPHNEVRFGATVKLKMTDRNIVQEFQLVGVDEADTKAKKVAFIAPIALAITGKSIGETALLRLGNREQKIEILEISYS